MPCSPQEHVAALLSALGCPAPWAVDDRNGRVVVDAIGRPVSTMLQTAGPAVIRDRADVVVVAVNTAAGFLCVGAYDEAEPTALSPEAAQMLRAAGLLV